MKKQYTIRTYGILLFILVELILVSHCFTQTNLNNNAIELYDSSWIYFNSGNSNEAINSLNKAISIKQQFKYDSFPELFKIYNRLGIINKKLGYFTLAIENYTTALKHTPDKYYQALIHDNIANVYLLKGDYLKGIGTYENSLIALKKSNRAKNFSRIVSNYNNQGLAYYRMQKYDLALQKYLQSLEIAKKCKVKDILYINKNCAETYEKMDSLDLAEKYYKKELRYTLEKYGAKHIETAVSQLYLANFCAKIKEYKKASSLFNKVYTNLITTLGYKHPRTAQYYKYFGDMHSNMADYKQALSNYQQALISKIPAFNDSTIYSNPNTEALPDIFLLEILKSKAHALEKLSGTENREANLIAALQTLELTTEFIEQLREGYLYETSKLELAEKEHDTYLSIIGICYTLLELTGNPEYINLAFKYSERGKYAVLRETINEETARGAASIPDNITGKEKRLKEQIGHIRRQIVEESKQAESGSLRINILKQELFSLSQKREAIIKKLEEDYPKYYRQKYDNRVAGIKELQKVLSDKEAVISYELSDSLLYTFVITNKTQNFICSPLDTAFYFYLKEYKDYFHSVGYQGYIKFRISSYVLYNNLITPIKHLIKSKNLLIIPDSKMSTIAFESFTTEPYIEKGFADFCTEPYFILKYTIGYSYSATLFLNSKIKKRRNKLKFLGFAPDYANSRDSLTYLPMAPKYLKKVSRLFNRRIFTHDEATEYNFKKQVKDYGIIHFFAHGIEDTLNPSLSKIYLSYNNDTIEDGYLYAYEVNELDMNAELIVLASCNSGTGAITKSEGALSIGRSFMNSDNSSIVLSLWTANVYVSNVVLKEFYKQIILGKRKDEALRMAKLKYLESAYFLEGDPKYWNSLVIIGNQDALFSGYWIKRVLLCATVLIVITLIVRRVRKHNLNV